MLKFSILAWTVIGAVCATILGCASAPPVDHIDTLVSSLADQLSKTPQPADGARLRVGIVSFTDKSHQATALSTTLQERLFTKLVQTQRFEVVDKADMAKALEELQTQSSMSDVMDQNTLSELHRIVAAQALVTGTITDAASSFYVDCRLIDTSRSTALAAAQGSISKSDLGPVLYNPPVRTPVVPPAYPPPPPPPSANSALEPLVAPIALYPDPLLACVLPASTYPDQVQQAQTYIQSNSSASDDQIAAQNWDPSVQALAHYPAALQQMSGDPQWTSSLGSAYTSDPTQVMATIQDMRAQAVVKNNLVSTPNQVIGRDGATIFIQPVSQSLIVVPTYDPVLVYTGYCPIVYSPAYRIGPWFAYGFDWGGGAIYVGDWHGRYWYSGGYWRHDAYWAARSHRWAHDYRYGPPPHIAHAAYAAPRRIAGREAMLRGEIQRGAVERQRVRTPSGWGSHVSKQPTGATPHAPNHPQPSGNVPTHRPPQHPGTSGQSNRPQPQRPAPKPTEEKKRV